MVDVVHSPTFSAYMACLEGGIFGDPEQMVG